VTITEVIKNDRNSLAKVIENGREYWICTEQEGIDKGRMYIYSSIDAELLPPHQCEVTSGTVDSVWMVKKLVPGDNDKHPQCLNQQLPECRPTIQAEGLFLPKLKKK
jgi:hypothetical protein